MPFRGPSQRFAVPQVDFYDEDQQNRQAGLSRAIQQEQTAYSRGRDLAASADRDLQYRDQQDAGRQQLAMTPGVSRGGSTATVDDPTSIVPRAAATTFSRFGDTYSYDPFKAAEDKGTQEATEEETANKSRYIGLQQIPGISQRQAAKLVYGRGTVLDEADPSEMRSAVADYVRSPSRETAARAVSAGASLNSFPERFLRVKTDAAGGELPARPEAPVFGTPEYDAALERSEAIRSRFTQQDAVARAAATADQRPATRDRMRGVTGPNGEIGQQNLDTGEVTWTGAVGAKPGKSSALDEMIAARTQGAPAAAGGTGGAASPAARVAAPVVPPARARPSAGAGGGKSGMSATGAGSSGITPLDPKYESQLEAAFQSLQKKGIRNPTSQQLRAEMTAIGGAGGGGGAE